MKPKTRLTLAAIGVAAAGLLVVPETGRASAPGWKYVLPEEGCVLDCSPVEEWDLHCPCYEMPPIPAE